MPVRGRLARARAGVTSVFLAFLVASLAMPGIVAAANATASSMPVPLEPVTPRAQKVGDATGYRLPFAVGLQVPIHQGWNDSYSHYGRAAYAYDFGLVEGTPVLAAASGVVAFAHTGETACGGKELRKKANYVTINHPDGSATQYGHLQRVEVKIGQVVTAGQRIGTSGKTGFTGCQPHLHFARQVQGGGVTQSVPIYFEGYTNAPFHLGEVVTAEAPACSTRKTKELPVEGFCATYSEPDGTPLFSRLEPAVDFDWSGGAPGGYWLDEAPAGFEASWSGRFDFEQTGTYSFDVVTSDRVKVVVDGVTVLDDWGAVAGLHATSGMIKLDAGVHRIDVRHADGNGAGILRLSWERLPDDPNRWSRSGPLIR